MSEFKMNESQLMEVHDSIARYNFHHMTAYDYAKWKIEMTGIAMSRQAHQKTNSDYEETAQTTEEVKYRSKAIGRLNSQIEWARSRNEHR